MIQTCTYLYSSYVLSTMGVSKESISKFLIGNRFHVKLRILSLENCKLCALAFLSTQLAYSHRSV